MRNNGPVLSRNEREILKDVLWRWAHLKVLVVGDLILDEYIWGNVSRISPEAPVPVVEASKHSYSPGGASYVASLVQYLEGQAFPVGVVGKDPMGKKLKGLLAKEGAKVDGMVEDRTRPTTLKTRVMAQRQQIVRIDHEFRGPVSSSVTKQLLGKIRARLSGVEAVIISDYAKGVLSPAMVQGVIHDASRRKIPVVVDPKPASGIHFKGATVITPNTVEAGQMAGMAIQDEAGLLKAGRALMEKIRCQNLLITRGEHGMSLFERSGQVTHIPTRAREVFDVSGAGDAVVSSMALALAAGATMLQAAELANFAAGVEVGKLGTAKITRQEIAAALDQSL